MISTEEAEVIALFRKLSASQREAALTMAEHLTEGRPITEVGLTFLIACGMGKEEAERTLSMAIAPQRTVQ
jgi:hypothetical protein